MTALRLPAWKRLTMGPRPAAHQMQVQLERVFLACHGHCVASHPPSQVVYLAVIGSSCFCKDFCLLTPDKNSLAANEKTYAFSVLFSLFSFMRLFFL